MVHLLGIPYDANSSFLRGPAYAPARIRLMGSEGSANFGTENGPDLAEGTHFTDLGDLAFEDSSPEKAHHTIKNAVAGQLAQGRRLLCLGGDHSTSGPVIEAHAEAIESLHVLQFDAHTDLYNNFDNNPYSHASPFARLMEKGLLKSLTQVGLRTLTAHQREQAQRFGVKMVEMKEFSTDFLTGLQGPLYISFDMDVLDPAFAPGVSHHEPGGISTRQALDMLHQIKVPVVGADVMEYNPVRDTHNLTAMVAWKMMKELMVKML